MKPYFEGWYFKLQKGNRVLALIPGRSDETAFIQVITNERAWNIEFPLDQYKSGNLAKIGENVFSKSGLRVNIQTEELSLKGTIRFDESMPLQSDIMGPFQYLPMECRHTVLSMHHRLTGCLMLNDELYDFTGGSGYLEGDSGTSFPSSYSWFQCGMFGSQCAVMASIAVIPLACIRFRGCIASVLLKGKEYRFATYRGVRVQKRTPDHMILKQGRMRLEIEILNRGGHLLKAPQNGKMHRMIRENPAVTARIRFSVRKHVLFDIISDHASYEYVQ